MKGGVPFHIAFDMSPAAVQVLHLTEAERLAFQITLSEFEGNTFDWDRMKWVETNS